MPVLPTISTIFIILSASLVTIGWYMASKKRFKLHKRMMVSAAILAVCFFITYAIKIILYGDNSFGGPDNLRPYYLTFLVFHIILATTSAVFGIVTLLLAFKRKIRIHRKMGPITSVMWLISAVTGLMVYLLLYIIY